MMNTIATSAGLYLPADPDFVAIDFETANRDPASACAIGLALVKAGQVVANPSWLIRPPRLYFDPAFIQIHGIDADKVINEPEFDLVWEWLKPQLDGTIIIAHNAVFDINVLKNTLDYYRLPFPTFRYSCTKIIAQKTWPTYKRYNLAELALRHGFEFKHHDAAEDARVCAGIALKAFAKHSAGSFDELNKQANISYGRLSPTEHVPVEDTLQLPELGGFGGWEPHIHRQAEQVKRRQRAAGLTDSVIDQDNQSGVINNYTVTLDSCSCIDFRERRLPCKHIYHLFNCLIK
jgi:DNA polymerase III subunit epsilon